MAAVILPSAGSWQAADTLSSPLHCSRAGGQLMNNDTGGARACPSLALEMTPARLTGEIHHERGPAPDNLLPSADGGAGGG